jgi:iron complex outermembrane recepter protein
MFKKSLVSQAVNVALGSALLFGASVTGAQTAAPAAERVEITGTRILRTDLQSSSPLVTVPASEIVGRQDVTLDTVLNTLPQVNPAGGTTSNNPGNGGQSNIDLRGLGSNRNLILIDGRRAMVSASDQTVDLNTIPMALIDSIEVITGGAGAVYGADAVAGVVNIKLRKRFEGLTMSAGGSQSTEKRDGRETRFSILGGTNFQGNTGNASIYFDYSKRDALIKGQRAFAAVATSTTSFFPEGSYRPTGNNPSQSAIDALFSQASYRQPFPGKAADPATGLVPYSSANVPASAQYLFNSDGTPIPVGIFNNATVDVRNWRYPVDLGVNSKIFPDAYSYNFDAVNLLVLPLTRTSLGAKIEFSLPGGTELFSRFNYTSYSAKTALAPTPIPTINVLNPALASVTQGASNLVVNGRNAAGTPRSTGNNLVVPVTNPFISADLASLLASRTGDNVNLVGSGATEPFLMRWRSVPLGLRQVDNGNNVTQGLVGAKGDLLNTGWVWEAYASYGQTIQKIVQTGNLNTTRLQAILEAPDGGRSLCAGGVNPFGRQGMSAECVAYLSVDGSQSTTFTQKIAQAFVSGDVAKLPAGSMAAVVGAELRDFSYNFKPGSAAGPISGFNVQNPAQGTNNFTDLFGELQIPLARRAPFAQSLDLSLAARTSQSEFEDKTKAVKGDKQRSNTFAMNLTWEPTSGLRGRGSLQRSVRAPNFGELFDGGTSAPQYFDPCSASTVARTTGPAGFNTLCTTLDASGVGGAGPTYAQTPGSQSQIVLDGNPALKAEKGTSVTMGLVFQASSQSPLRGLTASVDYYQITVKDAIIRPDANEIIADCYNFYGANSGYSVNHPTCQGINRAGSDIFFIGAPGTASGNFLFTNGGRIKTAGIDLALGWAGRVGPGQFNFGVNYNHLLEYKSRSASYLPEKNYKGTIPFFGAGFGQAFPANRVVLTTGYKLGDFGVDARYRWFSAMGNRMSLNFPGEKFTGTAATGYLDLGASVELLKTVTLRVGLNNALDQEPRTYAPNVQSGTDPSTFDVVGRRLFVQATAKF